jgi:amino acid adenylation domain-containing protein
MPHSRAEGSQLGGVVSAAASALLPIASLQKSMLLASLRAPRDGVYLVQDVCELDGAFDVRLLHSAWRAVVERHPAIRRAVCFRDRDPAGFRFDHGAAEHWREEDYTNLPAGLQEGRIESLLRVDRERGFDFDGGAPVRVTVIRTSGSSVTLVWTIHHALLDGRSLTAVWQAWLAHYDALIFGPDLTSIESRDLPLIEPPAALEPDCVSNQDSHAGAEHFWRGYLGGLSETTDYIVDRIRPAAGPEVEPTGRERVVLSENLTRQLRDFSALHSVALNNIVQGAWALLLSRYSGRQDVVFGVTRAGRTSSPEDSRKVGFYINTLPLRIGVDPRATLGPWLKELRSRWLALRDVERTPLHQAVKWSDLPPGMPPFDSLLNYEHEPPGEALHKLGGHWSGARLRRLQRTDSPLTLAAYGSPALTLEVIFDAGRFSTHTMVAAAGHLKELLESFVSQPGARLCDLNMLPAEERKLLLQGARSMPLPGLCIHQIFEQQAERTPSNTAIDTGSGCISYRELNERSNRLAWRLRQAGVRAGDLVAVCMDASPESVIAILAALKAGAAFLPADPNLPEQRLEAVLADARPRLVLCRGTGAAAIRSLKCEILSVDSCTINSWDAEPAVQARANPPTVVTPADLAYMIYTSGSSGQPKAVVMPHLGLVNHSVAASSVYGISETDRRLQLASIGSDVFIAEVFNYLCRGAALVFGWDRQNRSVREFLRCLEDRRITITGIPSAWWSEWMAAVEQSGSAPPACLRAVVIGMEKADPATFLIWKNVAGKMPRLFNAYGPSEASPTATVYEAGSSPWEASSYVPIGKPLANTSVYVLDEHGSPVPIGVPGELHIGGCGVARGYWNRPALTAERFVPDAFRRDESSRLYRTGDIVFYLPDGNLVFVGRADRQVKIRGFRVELDEIETVLASHAEVKKCAVVLAREGERQFLGAFVTSRGGSALSPEALRAYLGKRLPEHMIPVSFVTLPELPVTPNGKIDRQSLPVPELDRVSGERGFQSASTETERRLAEIWEEVLKVSPIGAADNFFELGADSLAATRLITLVEARFGVEMPASLLWRVPTLAGMASVLESREPPVALEETDSVVVALQPHGSRIPFFCFPGADDNPGYFLPLARSLGNQQPFYVVRDPRPLSERGAYTVEQAAERLVEAIRQVRKTGPYVVGGHCYGGLVAFEAARRLAALGETVSKVAMIEVPAPGYPKVLRNWRNYLRLTMPILRGQRRVTRAEVRQHVQVLSKLARKRAASWTRRAARGTPLADAAASFEDQVQPSLHPNAQAGRIYAPKPFACDLVQIIAAGEHHSTVILDDPRLGWRDLTVGTFAVAETPGPAGAIFKQPYVRGLAAQIESLLDGPNGRQRSSTQDGRAGPV